MLIDVRQIAGTGTSENNYAGVIGGKRATFNYSIAGTDSSI
ncbi:hypothetical protein TcasGA2_TC032458 [Tribolium castaneum]|uniref:Uncharacterized protein n=1 Tax=Tribolium castaneum TaxID=7070 RepID=A0A139WL33_TRICA|nr:hypothetical protein TcasGA2_TC032458 [Tribolium castaneum]